MAATETPLLEIAGLEHHLRDPAREEEFILTVERRLTVYPSSFVAILGPSGCGKTTLLTILGLLRRPSDPEQLDRFAMSTDEKNGTAGIHDVRELWQRNRQGRIETLRRRHIGFALQSGELLPSLNVRENIALPLRLNGGGGRRCWHRVDELITAFGLRDEGAGARTETRNEEESSQCVRRNGRLSKARVNKLSGGEYQRVVLARAIAHRPRIVFVDEPTAALNRELARKALQQLKESQTGSECQGAVVMITHDEWLASEFADRIIRMAPETGRAAGRVVEVASNTPRS